MQNRSLKCLQERVVLDCYRKVVFTAFFCVCFCHVVFMMFDLHLSSCTQTGLQLHQGIVDGLCWVCAAVWLRKVRGQTGGQLAKCLFWLELS